MNEMLLHYFWKNRILSVLGLQTTNGRPLRLLRTGFPHQDAGPDFKQAVIKIDDITWVGDVEIHWRSSDWLRHGHQKDEKYASVILHVVYDNDTDLGLSCPTLELKKYVSPSLLQEYEQLAQSLEMLPCRSFLPNISSLQFASWLSRLAVERYKRKSQEVLQVFHSCHDSWHEAVFRRFVSNFGFRTNADAFDLLGKSLPYRHVLKHKDSRLQVYALVFGQAGMLDDERPDDEYYATLQTEYRYLRYKYGLSSIPLKVWNLLRLRPQNFPCLRLAQLSECLYRIPDLMDELLNCESAEVLGQISEFVPNPYWETHRHFGRDGPVHSCQIGQNTVNLLIINTVVPVKLAYASFRGDERIEEQAFTLLEKAPFENNVVTRRFVQAGFPDDSALYSQAMLELYKFYCTPKQCLRCDIGCAILKNY